ncbi:MAG: hypothetical protein AAF502_07270 [Bacteroidota bacterium]
MRFISFTILFGLIIIFSGCEGFKMLTLHNFSQSEINLTIKPRFNKMERHEIVNYPSPLNKNGDSLNLILPKDSSIVLTSIFTSFLGGARLKEEDIRIDYLKIQTEDSTFIAKNKKEILDLVKSDKFKFRKSHDKERKVPNTKNFGNIIIRK